MKRYASHFLFLPGHGYLKQYVVEIGEGQCVSRIFLLTEEVENTEWLPGVIALLTEAETDYPHFDTCCQYTDGNPPVSRGRICLVCIPWLFFPFDFTTMLPGAGTQRKTTAVAIATFTTPRSHGRRDNSVCIVCG